MRFTIHTICFDTIDSTHTWGKKNFPLFDAHAVTCITALEQTAGIGRHQRTWFTAPPGMNIHATLCFTLPLIPNNYPYLANLGQLLSLSTAAVLEKCGFAPEIKWPNDIRVHGKKIAGILCEIAIKDDGIGVILSIGLNGNMTDDLLQKIDQPATSLAQLSGHSWNLEVFLESLVSRFLSDLETLESHGFAHFKDAYEQLLAFKGEKIRCFDGKQQIEGICQGILPDGRLQLLLESGEIACISAGDVFGG